MSESTRKNWRAVLALLAGAICFGPLRAHAETLPPVGGSSLSQLGLVAGSQSVVYVLSAPGAGTFNVSLGDLDWPDRLASLSFTATSANALLGSLTGAGQMGFEVAGAGSLYAHVAASAQGLLNVGLYSLQITFMPSVSAVPLPASSTLLLTALGALGILLWMRRPAVAAAPAHC